MKGVISVVGLDSQIVRILRSTFCCEGGFILFSTIEKNPRAKQDFGFCPRAALWHSHIFSFFNRVLMPGPRMYQRYEDRHWTVKMQSYRLECCSPEWWVCFLTTSSRTRQFSYAWQRFWSGFLRFALTLPTLLRSIRRSPTICEVGSHGPPPKRVSALWTTVRCIIPMCSQCNER